MITALVLLACVAIANGEMTTDMVAIASQPPATCASTAALLRKFLSTRSKGVVSYGPGVVFSGAVSILGMRPDEMVLPPILELSIQKCAKTDEHTCGKDSLEWIGLNLAGAHVSHARALLAHLEREHAELHAHLEKIPPLAAEQRDVDEIEGHVRDARALYAAALPCGEQNHALVARKAAQLESDVVERLNKVELEVRKLRRRRKRPKPKKAEVKIEVEPDATCPNEIHEIHAEGKDAELE